MTPRQTKAEALLMRFETAVRRHALIGGIHPDEHAEIEDAYAITRFALKHHIERQAKEIKELTAQLSSLRGKQEGV